jgi:hypothetical protein
LVLSAVADREFVESLSTVPCETVERDLSYLPRPDDVPVVKIGSLWKAKSPSAHPCPTYDRTGGALS